MWCYVLACLVEVAVNLKLVAVNVEKMTASHIPRRLGLGVPFVSSCSTSDNFSFFSDPGNFFHPRTRFSYKVGTKKM